jgi:hypothetical protein
VPALIEEVGRLRGALSECVERSRCNVTATGLGLATPAKVEKSVRDALLYVAEPAFLALR